MHVDAINAFGVSAGRVASFRVVSRHQIHYFRSSSRFMRLVRFPAAPQQKVLVSGLSVDGTMDDDRADLVHP